MTEVIVSKMEPSVAGTSNQLALRNMLRVFHGHFITTRVVDDNFIAAISFFSHLIVNLAPEKEEELTFMEHTIKSIPPFKLIFIAIDVRRL